MTEEEWHRFVWGCDPQIATLGELPRDLCRVIGSASPIIRMHHFYALKSSQKHGLEMRHFPMLPITIEFGRCVLERPGRLSFFHFDDVVFGSWFHAVLKTNGVGTEIWVMTFHSSRPGEVGRISRKGTIIRPEKE
jgi:hypothetical protein